MANLIRFMVCGCFKSGTSIISEMLNMHPEIICTNELSIYSEKYDEWLLEQNLKQRKFRGLESKLDTDNFLKKLSNNYRPNNVLKTINELAPRNIKAYGDKYPLYTMDLTETTKHVSAVIFILRDPREILEAQVRTWKIFSPITTTPKELKLIHPYANETIEDCIKDDFNWLEYMTKLDEFTQSTTLPYLFLYYDKMHLQTKQLAEFLNIDSEKIDSIFKENYKPKTKLWEEKFSEIKLPDSWIKMANKLGLYN
jgi:hypothetical protein